MGSFLDTPYTCVHVFGRKSIRSSRVSHCQPRVASLGPRVYIAKGACISLPLPVGSQILPGYFPIPTTSGFNATLHLFKCISLLFPVLPLPRPRSLSHSFSFSFSLSCARLTMLISVLAATIFFLHEAICRAIEARLPPQIFQPYCVFIPPRCHILSTMKSM